MRHFTSLGFLFIAVCAVCDTYAMQTTEAALQPEQFAAECVRLGGMVDACNGKEVQCDVQLHKAVKEGDLARVIDLLKFVHINALDDLNQTALLFAAAAGHLPLVEFLLENGAAVNAQSRQGRTALFWALCKKKNNFITLKRDMKEAEAVVSRLMEAGASVTLSDLEGFSPLYIALGTGLYHVAHELIKHGSKDMLCHTARNNRTPLHVALAQGRYDFMNYISLEDLQRVTKFQDQNGRTLLHEALRGFATHKECSQKDALECVNKLRVASENLNTQDKDGWAALHEAVQCYKAERLDAKTSALIFVKMLLYGGANPYIKNNYGWTPLHLAVAIGAQDIVLQLLVSSDVNSQDINGVTPLHLAVRFKHFDIIPILLSAGADVRVKDMHGWTPLYWAENYQAHDVAALLREQAPDLVVRFKVGLRSLTLAARFGNSARLKELLGSAELIKCEDDPMGYFPLHIAAMSGSDGMVKDLLTHESDTCVYDNGSRYLRKRDVDERHGFTRESALHLASQYGHAGVVRGLLEHGARAQAHTSFFHTPLHLAAINGCADVAELLLDPKYQADPNALDCNGCMPLHTAACHGHGEVVRVLLEHGARTDAKNINGQTPLDLARARGEHHVADLLIAAQEHRPLPPLFVSTQPFS